VRSGSTSESRSRSWEASFSCRFAIFSLAMTWRPEGYSLPLILRLACRRGLVDPAFRMIICSPDLSVYPSIASAYSVPAE
jgi:hypothetical protein